MVELIPDKLAAGETVDQIVETHPRSTREGIHAVRSFAAETLCSDMVQPTDDQKIS